jgi:chromosome segregation ATPase
MVVLNESIAQLQEKIQLLLKAYKSIQKENQQLQKEAVALQQRQALGKQTLAQLSGGGISSDAEKQKLQQKIDAYLKEIDKCIALLHA